MSLTRKQLLEATALASMYQAPKGSAVSWGFRQEVMRILGHLGGEMKTLGGFPAFRPGGCLMLSQHVGLNQVIRHQRDLNREIQLADRLCKAMIVRPCQVSLIDII